MQTLGIVLAVLAGMAFNSGLVLQKKAVNLLPPGRDGKRFYAALVRQPLWLGGLLLQMGLGTGLLLAANLLIGPALVPGLMASGLIALAVGSALVVGEIPRPVEIVAILLLILAVVLLGLSNLVIDVRRYDLFGRAFLLRSAVFTAAGVVLVAALELAAARAEARRGLLLALSSGALFALSNFWLGPFMGVAAGLFGSPPQSRAILLIAVMAVILILTNVLGVGRLQTAFRYGRASQVVPVQQLPIQIAPVLVYLAVFNLQPPSGRSLLYLSTGIALVLLCSFLLAGGQTRLDAGS